MATESVNPSRARSCHRRTFQNVHAATTLEGAIRLVTWANSQRREVSAHQIRDFLGCSRATSYRYLAALRAAGAVA